MAYMFKDKTVANTLKTVSGERLTRVFGHERVGFKRAGDGGGSGAPPAQVVDITESGGIDAGATGEVTPKDSSGTPGTPFQATNASNVEYEENMQAFAVSASGYTNPILYPYQFSECETPRPTNVSPEV